MTDWYVQWPNNVFKDLGSFLPSAPSSQVVAFSSSYLWPHGHIMVIPVRCHSCSSAVKMGRKESRSKGALLVSRSKKYHNFPITHYVILGNTVSLGGKGARECERSKSHNHLDCHDWFRPKMDDSSSGNGHLADPK